MQIDKDQVGKILAALRADNNMSQSQLALKLEIPRPAVSQIENGIRDLSFLELQKILQLFGISYEEFHSYLKPTNQIKSVNIKAINQKIKFDSGKFKQLFLYILEKCGSKPNVGETVLYKLLYFCDFDFFEINEVPPNWNEI